MNEKLKPQPMTVGKGDLRPVLSVSNLTDAVRWNILQKKTQEARVVQAFGLFRGQGIEPVLIKGYAAARNYPEEKLRLSLDVDFAVPEVDFERAQAIETPEGLGVDVHRELRKLDTVPWADLWANTQNIDVNGVSVRILRPEDHLRVLCVHWLTDGGSDRDRLWDVYYAIENRAADFDWARFLDAVSPRRRRWLVCTVGLAHRYLGLELAGTPIEREARDLPAWLIKAVEREWAAETKVQPMEFTLDDPRLFARQMTRRLSPNPIRATVESEGSFDARTRFFYRIRNFLSRVKPTARRIFRKYDRDRAEPQL